MREPGLSRRSCLRTRPLLAGACVLAALVGGAAYISRDTIGRDGVGFAILLAAMPLILVAGEDRFSKPPAAHQKPGTTPATIAQPAQTLAEHKRLADRLHDGLCQSLALAKIRLDLIERQIDDPDLRRDVEKLGSAISSAIAESRALLRDCSPAEAAAPLDGSIRALAQSTAADYGLHVNLQVPGSIPEVTPVVSAVILDGVREFLINIAKHAGAREADILVESNGSSLLVTVSDRGVGFGRRQSSAEGGYGLSCIERRLAECDGALCVESRPGTGCRVTMSLPVA